MLLRFITLSRWDQPAAFGDLPTFAQVTWPELSLRTPPQLDYRTGTGRAKDGLFRDPDGPVAVTPAVFSSLSPLAVPLLLKPRAATADFAR